MEETRGMRAALLFRIDEFDRIVEPLGYDTEESKRRLLGVSTVTMWRLRKQQSGVSTEFLARVKSIPALEKVPFETLFTIKKAA